MESSHEPFIAAVSLADFSARETEKDHEHADRERLQKKKVFPSRSAWRTVASSTVIPQMGSLVTYFDSFMVMLLSGLLSLSIR
jgi:hypothetical protein